MTHAQIVQPGTGARRVVILSYYTPNNPATSKWPALWDAMRAACGPEPCILAHADDGDPLRYSATQEIDKAQKEAKFVAVGVVLCGWSAGCRGVRNNLAWGSYQGDLLEIVRALVLCDGVHAPMVKPIQKCVVLKDVADDGGYCSECGGPRDREERYWLGPSEVFRPWIERANSGDPCVACNGAGYKIEGRDPPFSFGGHFKCMSCCGTGRSYPVRVILTHTYQETRFGPPGKTFLPAPIVARELTGLGLDEPAKGQMIKNTCGGLEVWSDESDDYDRAEHSEQQRVRLPEALARLRELGVFNA